MKKVDWNPFAKVFPAYSACFLLHFLLDMSQRNEFVRGFKPHILAPRARDLLKGPEKSAGQTKARTQHQLTSSGIANTVMFLDRSWYIPQVCVQGHRLLGLAVLAAAFSPLCTSSNINQLLPFRNPSKIITFGVCYVVGISSLGSKRVFDLVLSHKTNVYTRLHHSLSPSLFFLGSIRSILRFSVGLFEHSELKEKKGERRERLKRSESEEKSKRDNRHGSFPPFFALLRLWQSCHSRTHNFMVL